VENKSQLVTKNAVNLIIT